MQSTACSSVNWCARQSWQPSEWAKGAVHAALSWHGAGDRVQWRALCLGRGVVGCVEGAQWGCKRHTA